MMLFQVHVESSIKNEMVFRIRIGGIDMQTGPPHSNLTIKKHVEADMDNPMLH